MEPYNPRVLAGSGYPYQFASAASAAAAAYKQKNRHGRTLFSQHYYAYEGLALRAFGFSGWGDQIPIMWNLSYDIKFKDKRKQSCNTSRTRLFGVGFCCFTNIHYPP